MTNSILSGMLCLSAGFIFCFCSNTNSKPGAEAKSPDAKLAEVAGIYQMYVDNEPLTQNSQLYYLLNAQGVVLSTFGASAETAFLNAEEGLKNGLITTGSFKVSGSNLTFDLEKSSGPTEWKIDFQNKILSRDRASLHFVQKID